MAALIGPPAAHAGPGVTLPAPGGEPQSIDFAHDPLLLFLGDTATGTPFLDTLGRAVERHPAVAAALADEEATEGVRVQVRAGLFPQVGAEFIAAKSLTRYFPDRSAIVESLQPKSRSDVIVTGDQLLYDFGATGNRISAADDRIRAASAEVEQVAADTGLRAIAAWYDVLGYQSLVDLSEAMVGRQRSILADVRLRVRQGVDAAGDIARTEAVVADSEAEASRFTRLLEQARGRYREAFGVEPPARLQRSVPPRSDALSLDRAQMLGRKSPVVIAAIMRAEAARRDARAVRADGLPRLSASVNGSRYDLFSGKDYEVRGTIVLHQSLFAGGHQRGLVDESKARQRSAIFTADRVTGESERDAGIAFTDVVALGRTEKTLEAAYTANRRARDTYVEQFRVSRGSLIELLRAEREYFNAATALLQGVIELDVARYTLLARTGEFLPVIGVKLVPANVS